MAHEKWVTIVQCSLGVFPDTLLVRWPHSETDGALTEGYRGKYGGCCWRVFGEVMLFPLTWLRYRLPAAVIGLVHSFSADQAIYLACQPRHSSV